MSNGTPTNAAASTSQGSSRQDHLVELTATALAGGALVALLLYLKFKRDTGDEPPIVVKNGSMDLRLATVRHKWEEDGGPKKWKISGGKTRGKDTLDVTVASTTGATCSSPTGTGKVVRITFSDGEYIDLEAKNKTTKVTGSKELRQVSDQLITYGSPNTGYISGIYIDGNGLCTFTEAKQLTHVLILDL